MVLSSLCPTLPHLSFFLPKPYYTYISYTHSSKFFPPYSIHLLESYLFLLLCYHPFSFYGLVVVSCYPLSCTPLSKKVFKNNYSTIYIFSHDLFQPSINFLLRDCFFVFVFYVFFNYLLLFFPFFLSHMISYLSFSFSCIISIFLLDFDG